jgi:hypothetical protein
MCPCFINHLMVARLTFSSYVTSAPSRRETGENHRVPNSDSMGVVQCVPKEICRRSETAEPCAVGQCHGGESRFAKKAGTLPVPTKVYNSAYLQSRPISPVGQQLEIAAPALLIRMVFHGETAVLRENVLRLHCIDITKNICIRSWKLVVFLRFKLMYLFSVMRY